MNHPKIMASLVILVLFILSFVNIHDAISSPESIRQSAEARKARAIERVEAIKNRFKRRRDGDGGNSPAGSWQPVVCETTGDCTYTPPNLNSFIQVGSQTQLRVQYGQKSIGCTTGDARFGAQINLPPGTVAGALSFDKFIDSETLIPAGTLGFTIVVVAFDTLPQPDPFNGNVIALGRIPNSVNGSLQTFDLTNMLPAPTNPQLNPISATPGTEMSRIFLYVNRNHVSSGTLRIANVRVNGIPQDVNFEPICRPDF